MGKHCLLSNNVCLINESHIDDDVGVVAFLSEQHVGGTYEEASNVDIIQQVVILQGQVGETHTTLQTMMNMVFLVILF